MTKKYILLTILLISLIGVSDVARSHQDFFTIGVILPLTGNLASFGPGILIAMEIAVDEINAAGGIPGVGTIQLFVTDSESTPAGAVNAASQLINVSNVQAIVGPLDPESFLAVTQLSIDNVVLHIYPGPAPSSMQSLDDNDLVWSTGTPIAVLARALADHAINQIGYSSVSVIGRNDIYGVEFSNEFASKFEALGGTVPSLSLYDPSTTDFSAEIAVASGSGADAISLVSYFEASSLISQMISAGVDNIDLFGDFMKNQDLIDDVSANVGSDFLSGRTGIGSAQSQSAGGDAFIDAYQNAAGDDPIPLSEHGYDAVAIIALAATLAGDIFGQSIADNIRAVSNAPGDVYTVGQLGDAINTLSGGGEVNYEGASGPIEFDASGATVGPMATWTIDEDGVINDGDVIDCSVGGGEVSSLCNTFVDTVFVDIEYFNINNDPLGSERVTLNSPNDAIETVAFPAEITNNGGSAVFEFTVDPPVDPLIEVTKFPSSGGTTIFNAPGSGLFRFNPDDFTSGLRFRWR